MDWNELMNLFLINCQQQLILQDFQQKRSNNWHHPILGWSSEGIDEGTQGTFGRIKIQLAYLWSPKMVHCLFGKVLVNFENFDLSKKKENMETVDLIQSKLLFIL